MKKLIPILFVLIAFSSCSEYQKALKSEDVGVKYDVAEKEYDKGKYDKAIMLFEQIAPSYRGKPQAEKMFYMYAQSLYKTEQFYSAGYQFESFVSQYPKSEKVEECAYLGALSYSKMSPVYSLDQADKIYSVYCEMISCEQQLKVASDSFNEAENKLKEIGRILYEATIHAEISLPAINGTPRHTKSVMVIYNNGEVNIR